eukprot:g2633.t1
MQSTTISTVHFPKPSPVHRDGLKGVHVGYFTGQCARTYHSKGDHRGKLRQLAAASLDEQVTTDIELGRLSDKRILVAGATGRTGAAVVEELVKERADVCAFVRNESKARERFPSIEVFKGDVTKYDSIVKAMRNVDAVICATGAKDFLLNPLGPFLTDFQGVGNLVSAAEKAKVEKFVLVSSIGVDESNPLIRLAFWGLLLNKKLGEQSLQRSTLDYTIIRPGGLLDRWTDRVKEGNVIMESAGTFGFGGRGQQIGGAILRSQVAQCCLEALLEPAATNKTVEIITKTDAPARSFVELFTTVE